MLLALRDYVAIFAVHVDPRHNFGVAVSLGFDEEHTTNNADDAYNENGINETAFSWFF